MWIYTAIVVTFSYCYFLGGIVPIVIGAWYGMWHVFWLGIAAWIINLVLVWCVRKSRMLD
jgi:hypothetical protein